MEFPGRRAMTLVSFLKFNCIKCGFVGNPNLTKSGKVLTALWLGILVAGVFVWPLLILWAVATVAAVLVFEKICCCDSCDEEEVGQMSE
jgi:hypothetical protein